MANFFNTSRYARDVAGDGGSGGRLKRVMHEQRFRVADSLMPKTGRVLDFGCGSGDYLKLLLARGYTGVGIDPAPELIKIAGGPEFRVGSVDDWPEGQFDVIVALSWSGETQELTNIIEYSRRFRIPLVAVTSNAASALGRQADIVLALPLAPEACPHGLAPTTSTLMQLALGDALAVALLEARGFTREDFRAFHPGGTRKSP